MFLVMFAFFMAIPHVEVLSFIPTHESNPSTTSRTLSIFPAIAGTITKSWKESTSPFRSGVSWKPMSTALNALMKGLASRGRRAKGNRLGWSPSASLTTPFFLLSNISGFPSTHLQRTEKSLARRPGTCVPKRECRATDGTLAASFVEAQKDSIWYVPKGLSLQQVTFWLFGFPFPLFFACFRGA